MMKGWIAWGMVAILFWPLAGMAREYNTTTMERAVVDMKPKDCLGNPLPPPATAQVEDFVVTSKDLETRQVAKVPFRLISYDSLEGVAEIIFPFRRGMVYEINLANRPKFIYSDCPGKPVATE